MSLPVIYKLTFSNGKVYIGQAKSFKHRMRRHIANSISNKSRLYNAWRKHGEPSKEILIYCSAEDVGFYEILIIAGYRACEKEFGYNTTSGGEQNPMSIPEVAAKALTSRSDYWLNHSNKTEPSNIMTKAWQDEAYRSERIAAYNDESVRAKKSAAMKESCKLRSGQPRNQSGCSVNGESFATVGKAFRFFGIPLNRSQRARERMIKHGVYVLEFNSVEYKFICLKTLGKDKISEQP